MKKFLKKLHRKFPLLLKRSSALIGAFMVFICSFITPAFASGVSDSSTSSVYYSYWNLEKIYITYSDGSFAIFDLPQTFYLTNSYYTQELSIVSSSGDDKILNLNTYVGSTALSSPSVAFLFSPEGMSKISFIFSNSVLKSSPSFGVNSQDPKVVCPVFTHTSNISVSSFTGTYTSVRPANGVESEDFTFKFYNNSSSFGLTPFDSPQPNYYYLALNNSILDSEFDYYRSEGFNHRIPYFSEIITNISLSTVSSSGIYNFGIALPLGVADSPLDSFNSVSDWYSYFFTSYEQVVSPTNVDFTSWISTALGGFLRFEIVPGISLTTLLFFMLGIGAVNLFLKFFAGG